MTEHLAAQLAATFGLSDVVAVEGGHQAQVFTAVGPDGSLIVKVIDAALTDAAAVLARVTMVAILADAEPAVCRPLVHAGRLVHEVDLPVSGTGLATLWEFAEGRAPDPGDHSDAALMGATLARLHTAMAMLDPSAVPAVATYRGELPSASWQVLHGDFNTANLRIDIDGAGVRVFDFDDCGRGPIEFDVANAIYMVLFDSHLAGTPAVAQRFRTALLHGYSQQSGITLSGDVLDREIDRRVDALAGWLNVPETAPVGIRTSTDEWKHVLRAFVDTHRHP